jgi:hypothetical protein
VGVVLVQKHPFACRFLGFCASLSPPSEARCYWWGVVERSEVGRHLFKSSTLKRYKSEPIIWPKMAAKRAIMAQNRPVWSRNGPNLTWHNTVCTRNGILAAVTCSIPLIVCMWFFNWCHVGRIAAGGTSLGGNGSRMQGLMWGNPTREKSPIFKIRP